MIVNPKHFVKGIDWCSIYDSGNVDSVASFSLNEIRSVVFDCDRNKSPRSEGFSIIEILSRS